MLISEAFAQSATDSGGAAGGLQSLLASPVFILIPIFIIFYFLMWRPQQQKARDHREMVANLRRCCTVVTGGGLIGKVAKVDDTEVVVELAEGVRVKVVRSMITEVRAKGEPVKDKAEPVKENG